MIELYVKLILEGKRTLKSIKDSKLREGVEKYLSTVTK